MKKLVSFVLTLVMVVSVAVPAQAAVRAVGRNEDFNYDAIICNNDDGNKVIEKISSIDVDMSLYCLSTGRFVTEDEELTPGVYQVRYLVYAGTAIHNSRLSMDIDEACGQLVINARLMGTLGKAKQKQDRSSFILSSNLTKKMRTDGAIVYCSRVSLQSSKEPYNSSRPVKELFQEKGMSLTAPGTNSNALRNRGGVVLVEAEFYYGVTPL